MGYTPPIIEVEEGDTTRRHAYEHPLVVRLAHWLGAFTLAVLTLSGLEIFAAFPSFGDKVPQADLLDVPPAFRLGGWLGGALQWHLTFQWVFVGLGLVYALHQAVTGRWRQTLLLPGDVAGVVPMARHYLGLGPRPPATGPYNPLQKLAYTAVLLLGTAAAVTGWMLYKPVQLAPLVGACGGFGMVRLWHFLAMCGLVLFVPGHLLMVALHGWNNLRSMLTGYKADPEYPTGDGGVTP
jgi:Ni/Fe-hydrogenase b-type cytochrome subunit